MNIKIHRGSKQIGGTCIELESDGDRIILDFGLPLDGDANDVSLVPKIIHTNLKAVIVSHPHIDHYGLLHHLPENIPVLIGDSARNIIKTASMFTKQKPPIMNGLTLEDRKTITIGTFKITPHLVDHSAFDAYSFLIESKGKRLFYSGDFRGHGRKASLFEKLINNPPKNIDALLMEGSSLSRLDNNNIFPTEIEIENQLIDKFQAASGLVMMHTSAQNIDRIVSLYRACKRTGKTLIIDLYAAAILEATGHNSIPKSSWPNMALFIPESQRQLIKKNQWFDLLKKHSTNRIFPEILQTLAPNSVILFRPLMMNDLDNANCLNQASFIYSQWQGYLEKGTYLDMQKWLENHRINIEYIHTSGHANPIDLKRFSEALAPKSLIPIHSFSPEKYSELFTNVVYRQDGAWWSV